MTATAPAPTTTAAPPSQTKTAVTAPVKSPQATPTADKPKIKATVEPEYADAFADIDEMAGKKQKKQDDIAKVEKSRAKENHDEEVVAVEEPEVAEEAKPEADKPKDEKERNGDGKIVGMAALKKGYNELKEKVSKEYEPALKRLPELEAKLKEYESRDETATKAAQEKYAAIEKRNAELENHIRFADYEKSKDYQDQFQKPYEEAWGNALRELKGLTMKLEDPKTGEEIVREVTQADIAYFANLDPAARRTEINRLFPEDKEEVKRHINQISYLADKSHQAKEKAKADAETHSKTTQIQQREAEQNRAKLWKLTNEGLATKYPHWFAKAEGDQDGNTIFDRGTALADLLFNPSGLTPERVAMLPRAFKDQIAAGKPFSESQLTNLNAIVYNKAANHDRLAHQNKSLKARVAELEGSLKEFEASEPDNVRAGKASNGASVDRSWESEIDELDRKRR